jgi:hypothetical protein
MQCLHGKDMHEIGDGLINPSPSSQDLNFTEEEEKALVRKQDKILPPLMGKHRFQSPLFLLTGC